MRRAFSVAAYAVNRGEVLLVHHKRLALWLPVGGEVEQEETPLEAAWRELKEETDLDGDFDIDAFHGVDGTPPALLAYEEHQAGSKGLHLNFNFVCRVSSREIRGDGSFLEHGWFGREGLAKLDCPGNVRECALRALDLVG